MEMLGLQACLGGIFLVEIIEIGRLTLNVGGILSLARSWL